MDSTPVDAASVTQSNQCPETSAQTIPLKDAAKAASSAEGTVFEQKPNFEFGFQPALTDAELAEAMGFVRGTQSNFGFGGHPVVAKFSPVECERDRLVVELAESKRHTARCLKFIAECRDEKDTLEAEHRAQNGALELESVNALQMSHAFFAENGQLKNEIFRLRSQNLALTKIRIDKSPVVERCRILGNTVRVLTQQNTELEAQNLDLTKELQRCKRELELVTELSELRETSAKKKSRNDNNQDE